MAFYVVRAPQKLLAGPLVLGLAVWVSLLGLWQGWGMKRTVRTLRARR